MSDFVLDASVALQWLFEDEIDRGYSLEILSSLSEKRAVVPMLWFYEVGNGIVVGARRKRFVQQHLDGFLTRLKALPIEAAPQVTDDLLRLPGLALSYGLTNYDAAYLELSSRLRLPLATTDVELRKAASSAGVSVLFA